MKRIIQVIPLMLLMLVTGFSQLVLSPYLIVKGMMPREGYWVTMFGITAFFLGLLGGWLIAMDNKKRFGSKESK